MEQQTDERNPTIQTLALAAGGVLIAGTWLPLFSGQEDSIADGGSTLVVYVLITAALISTAVLSQWRGAPLLAAGAATSTAGIMVFLDAVSYSLLDSYSDFDSGLGVGGGLVMLTIFVALAASLLITALRAARANVTDALPAGGYTALGVISSAALTVGVMLPATKSGVTFAMLNFDWDPWYLQVSWLLFVGLLGLPGVVGFASAQRWGIPLALGGFAPTLWLVISSADDGNGGDRISTLFSKVHPVLIIAMVANVVAMLWARSATALAGSTTTQSSPPTSTTTAASSAATPGRWDTDPDGRHELRYHDGKRWTAHVSDSGIRDTDPPGPKPQWDTDPFGRHELRYHNGKRWTAHVSDNGVVGVDEPGFAPPPPPAIP